MRQPIVTHGPYVEMLVPRRKGQLLKLLILVPLSLLLATSIYYQFYYELPNAASNSISASHLYSAPLQTQQSFSGGYRAEDESDYYDDDNRTLGGRKSVGSGRLWPAVGAAPKWPSRGLKISSHNTDTYLNKHNRLDPSQSQENSGPNYKKIRDKWNPSLINGRQKADMALLASSNNIDDLSVPSVVSSAVANSQKAQEQFVFDPRDNQLLALGNDGANDDLDNNGERAMEAQARKGLTETPGGSYKEKISITDRHKQQGQLARHEKIGEQFLSGDDVTSSLGDALRDEEAADAQDAAVIPPPNDPSAPGELGRPVVLKNLTKAQQDLVNVGWENNAFNQYISDIISVNRTLPDVRDPSCKGLKYPPPRQLPQTSVIICFHNEAWSVLLRTVHSIINRSPRRLIKEIILVDDFSTKAHLKQQLDDYVKPLGMVRVVRASKREGLIRARLLGARASTAPVLTFLDSHCECAEGWLEPLLSRIHEDRRAVVCPVIDVISDKTFEYHYKGDASAISVGGFDWNLQFNWHTVPEREKKRRKHPYEPLRSPTMAGGLFSIDKSFFDELGTYDSGFDIWGGENLELSFKTWMCGGTLEIMPCSHVGHVFRSRSPYKWRTGVNVLRRNSVRLAEVWMDDYKKYYYDRIGHDLGDFGDISERLELRKRLNCKPFSYFVKEIYPELFIPGESVAYGEVRNEAEGKIKMCLDSSARKSDYHKPLGVYPCHGSGGNQYWLLSRDGEIRRDEACVDYAGQDVVLFPCHGSGGNQLWYYEKDTMQVRHSTSGRCMELARDRIRIQMSDCDPSNDAQKWTFQHYNATLAAAH